ncbi:MAG: exonuclease SbcCD subunit D [Promethearchaeota archaeon]
MIDINNSTDKLETFQFSCDLGISEVKFIHASDIHLGCHQYRNELRSEDYIRAFEEILKCALDHQVNFIILGGDVFTSLEMLPGKLLRIIHLLIDFKNRTNGRIPIITIEGNHDIRKFSIGLKLSSRGQSWLKLISSLGLVVLLDANLEENSDDIFKPYDTRQNQGGKIRIENVVIHGIRYIGQEPAKYLPKIRSAINKEEGIFNILIQHYGIEGQMKNVPGVKLEDVNILKDRVDYLALGHFHKQFILDDWIYNPGSSEAASWIDSTFKRGVFLVEISHKEKIVKKVEILKLDNRRHQWETIFLPYQLRNKRELYIIILAKLEYKFKYINDDLDASDLRIPVLYLVLKGKRPISSFKLNERELKEKICERFPVIDVKVYQKFQDPIKKLDKYF